MKMSMKKIVFSILTVEFLALAGTASAQVGMMGGYWQGNTAPTIQNQQLNDAAQSIFKNQNVSSQSQLDCSKVTDDQFEKLGDSYMSVMLPNEQQHQAMENMMGGEGSLSLKQAHINMGRSYLGCWSNYNSGPVYMPMMGGTMGGFNSGWNMMNGYGGFSGFGWITTVLIWVLLILGIIAAVKWIRKKQ